MKKLLLITGILFTGCFSRTHMMTQENFNDIYLGTPMTTVAAKVGRPYEVYPKGDGTSEYEYIERFQMDDRLLYEVHYFLLVSNGLVIGKRISKEKPPAYELIYQEDPNFTN